MSTVMETYVSEAEISQMCRCPLNQPESSLSHLPTCLQQGSADMSSVVIPRAAEPCLLVLGSPTPGAAPGLQSHHSLHAQRGCCWKLPLHSCWRSPSDKRRVTSSLPAGEPALPCTLCYHHKASFLRGRRAGSAASGTAYRARTHPAILR